MFIHAEAAYRNLDNELMHQLPWLVYVNLLECCQQFLHNSNNSNDENPMDQKEEIIENQAKKECQFNSIHEAACALQIDAEATEVASMKAETMANIVIELTKKGYRVKNPEYVRYNYEHKTFSRQMKINDSQVVEIRQVPWTATPATIAHYFAGLNVHPGGVAIRLTDGRRSNTAIVAFDNSMNAQLAFARNQHYLCGSLIADSVNGASDVNVTSSLTTHIPNNNSSNIMNQNCVGNRSECSSDGVQQIMMNSSSSGSSSVRPMYLQIHTASGKEFVQCTGCDQDSVTNFLNQLTNGEQVVVRVRGLPYTTCKKQIIEFFQAVQAPVMLNEQGIYLVVYPDRRPTGDAFVLFHEDDTATKALTRHKDYLGDRYVELFKASPSEMVQVCYNVTLFHNSSSGQKTHTNLSNYQSNGGSLGVPLMNGATQINCLNLVNFIHNNNNTNNTTTTNNHNKETYFNTASFTQLKSALNSNALSNLQNLWNSNTLRLNLSPQQTVLPTAHHTTENILSNNNNNNTTTTTFNLPFIPSNDSSLSSIHPMNLSSSLLFTSNIINGTNTLIHHYDLTDPTNPDCPFARPMPIGGVCAMIQLNELPLETSRHDIRLYLGPANFAKVYRMRRMETASNQITSSWLLSLRNTTEAIQFIRDLIGRTFTVSTLCGNNQSYKTIPNIPTFALYNVDPNGKLSVVNLSDISFGIPLHRIHVTSLVKTNKSINSNLNCPRQPLKKHSIKTKVDDQTMLNAITSQVPLTDPNLTLKHTSPSSLGNFDVNNNYVNPTASFNLSSSSSITNQNNDNLLIPSSLMSTNSLDNLNVSSDYKMSAHINDIISTNHQLNRYNLPSLTASMVMLAGAPADATQEELGSLFKPVRNLLTAQPYFIPFQYHPNGTANFLANFNNPLDAQTAVRYCPNGSLRSNKYVIGAACLIPPTPLPTEITTGITSNNQYATPTSPIIPINATNLFMSNNQLINFSNLLNNESLNPGILFLPPTISTLQQPNRLHFQ
ncbi:unnamed protein product [Schistosoma turkestanicum]|nr:unnamed protein product [Schistosoma turkestanicum]